MSVPNNSNVYLPVAPVTPLYMLITNITQAVQMVVSGQIPNLFILPTNPNTYIVGQSVILTVPFSYGMFQANGLIGQIVAINNLDFTLNIDSTGFDAFVTPSGNQAQPASFAPAGSRNLQYNNSTDFVPFQTSSIRGN